MPSVVLIFRRSSSTLPALAIERLEHALGRLLGTEKRRDQELAADLQLTHPQRRWRLIVLRLAHPLRLLLRLAQDDEVITSTELLARGEIDTALAPTVLLEQPVDATAHPFAEQEIARVEGIAEQNLAALQGVENLAQPRLLIAALAFARPHGGIEQRPTAQAQQAHDPGHRKAQSGLLAARLRIGGLIRFGIGQGHGGAIDQTDRAAPPVPPGGGPLGNDPTGLTRQRRDRRQRQARPSTTVTARLRAARMPSDDHALDHGLIDHGTATAIRRQRLGEEHRSRFLRWKPSLTVLWEQSVDVFESLRSGEQVKQRLAARGPDVMFNALRLPRSRAMVRIHLGWILGWLLWIRNL